MWPAANEHGWTTSCEPLFWRHSGLGLSDLAFNHAQSLCCDPNLSQLALSCGRWSQVLQHSIILSHWGLTVPEDHCSAHDWTHSYERCRRAPKYPMAAGVLPCHVPEKARPADSGGSVTRSLPATRHAW